MTYVTYFRNPYVDICRWMSVKSCLNWLLEVKPCDDRVGPLVVSGLLDDSSAKRKLHPTISYQVCFL